MLPWKCEENEETISSSSEASPTMIWLYKCKIFCVYRPYKESILKEMNNDGWFRY